jgi:type IV pilus assembly protein PilN
MLKINLLAEGKRPAVARKGKAQLGGGGGRDLGNTLLLAGVVVGLLAAGIWFWMATNKLKERKAEVAAAQKEVEALQQVIKEVEEYKAKKADLERKIDVINGLKANQRGPVQIMDQVSRALPELLWLSNMDVAASTINIRGTALNMSAVANFIDNLDKVEEFAEPILNDATKKSVRGSRSDTYDFKINFGYSFQKPKTPTLTTTTGGGTAPGAPTAPVAGAIGTAREAQSAAQQQRPE